MLNVPNKEQKHECRKPTIEIKTTELTITAKQTYRWRSCTKLKGHRAESTIYEEAEKKHFQLLFQFRDHSSLSVWSRLLKHTLEALLVDSDQSIFCLDFQPEKNVSVMLEEA